jgi:hypothetical protein
VVGGSEEGPPGLAVATLEPHPSASVVPCGPWWPGRAGTWWCAATAGEGTRAVAEECG